MSIALARSRSLRTTMRRATITGAAAAAAVLLFAGPALAHVTVNPSSVPAGSTTELTFRVPNEEANAYTVKVDVQIPTAHPIAQFLVKPVVGWSVTVRTIKLAKPLVTDDGSFSQAVSEVIWSGGKILPGQFQDFSVSADPLPTGISQLAFKAIQTYSNGDVVRWIDLSQPGQPEPAHPAPVLTLTTSRAPATSAGAPAAPAAATSASSGSDGLARALAVAGLVVALLVGLFSLMTVRQARRMTSGTAAGAGTAAVSDLAGAANGRADDRVPAGAKTPAGAKASAQRPQPRRRG
jgi:uncharacterized protein YcnI